MKQLNFPFLKRSISHSDFNRLRIANAGNYVDKYWFYRFKKSFLEKYAKFNDYDVQELKIKCRSCGGTGTHVKYSWETGKPYDWDSCWHCINGIFTNKTVFLKRYVINNHLFHIPTDLQIEDFNVANFPVIINTINGYVKHEPVDNNLARKYFIYLMLKYDFPLLKIWMSYVGGQYKQRFNQYLECKKYNIRESLKKFIKGKEYEDLPF